MERRVTPKLVLLVLQARTAPEPADAAPPEGDALRPRRKKNNEFCVLVEPPPDVPMDADGWTDVPLI